MRKLILLLVVVLAPLSISYADNDIGCGVGTILWEGQSGVFAKAWPQRPTVYWATKPSGYPQGLWNASRAA